MEMLKSKGKDKNIAVLIITLFTFLRTLLLMSFNSVGIVLDDVDEFYPHILAIVLVVIIAFSFLVAKVIEKVSNVESANTKYLSILFLADMVFFQTQNSPIKFALSVAGLLFAVLLISNPNGKLGSVFVPVFCLVSCAVYSTSLFSYALLAVLFYAVINMNGKNVKKTAVVSFLSLLLAGVGYSLNNILCKASASFSSFVSKYSLADVSLQKSPVSYAADDMYILLFTIPFVLVFIWFVSEYFTAYNEDKNPTGNKILVPILSFSVMAANFASFYFAKAEVISVISLVPVAVIVAMVISGNVYAKTALDKMNTIVKNNKVKFAVVTLILCVVCLYFILKEAEFSGLIVDRATAFDI